MEHIDAEEPEVAESNVSEPKHEQVSEPDNKSGEMYRKDNRIYNVTGEVLLSRLFNVYFTFYLDGELTIGSLNPGKGFVNGGPVLMSKCRSTKHVKRLFPKGSTWNFDLVQRHPAVLHPLAVQQLDKTWHEKKYEWEVDFLWVGPKPNIEGSYDPFEEQDRYFETRMNHIDQYIFDSIPQELTLENENWFVTTIVASTKEGLPHPDSAEEENRHCKGVVVEIIRPHGGVVQVEGKEDRVFFHRCRFYINENQLKLDEKLLENISVGTNVNVDYIENQKEGQFQPVLEECKEKHVALLAYIGTRPYIPQIIFDAAFVHRPNKKQKVYKARVVECDPPLTENGPLISGIAELAHEKNSTSGTRFRFHREKLFFMGSSLYRADLAFFITPQCKTNEAFTCIVKHNSDPNDSEMTHELVLGWINEPDVSIGHLLNGLPRATCTTYDTLLYPRINLPQFTRHLAKDMIDVSTFQDRISGKVASKHDLLVDCKVDGDVAFGRIIDFVSSSQVQAIILAVETGPMKGKQLYVKRENLSAFGIRLDKANLRDFVEQNDVVFVRDITESTESYNNTDLWKYTAKEAWYGWPQEDEDSAISSMPLEERYKFLLYLESKDFDVGEFLLAVSGTSEEKIALPFRGEESSGRIVCLDRADCERLAGTKMGKRRSENGHEIVGGLIQVKEGPMAGEFVEFHRNVTWICNLNMAKADLGHLFKAGNTLRFEAREMPSREQFKFRDATVQYRATLTWPVVLERPKIIKQKAERLYFTDREKRYLKLTYMSINTFLSIVNGKKKSRPVAQKDPVIDHPRTPNITPRPLLEIDYGTLPVFCHGEEAVRICDSALNATGPTDLLVAKIVQSNANVQMAQHIVSVLTKAIEFFTQQSQSRPTYGTSAWANQGVYANSSNSWSGQPSAYPSTPANPPPTVDPNPYPQYPQPPVSNQYPQPPASNQYPQPPASSQYPAPPATNQYPSHNSNQYASNSNPYSSYQQGNAFQRKRKNSDNGGYGKMRR